MLRCPFTFASGSIVTFCVLCSVLISDNYWAIELQENWFTFYIFNYGPLNVQHENEYMDIHNLKETVDMASTGKSCLNMVRITKFQMYHSETFRIKCLQFWKSAHYKGCQMECLLNSIGIFILLKSLLNGWNSIKCMCWKNIHFPFIFRQKFIFPLLYWIGCFKKLAIIRVLLEIHKHKNNKNGVAYVKFEKKKL